MKVATLYFSRKEYPFLTMRDTLLYSLHKHMPDAHVDVIQPEMSQISLPRATRSDPEKISLRLWDNMLKMLQWRQYIYAQAEGEQIILLDCDTLVLGDLAEGFQSQFDIGLTVTGRAKEPVNTGVVFFRNTYQTREFLFHWVEVALRMYVDEKFHNYWRKTKKYWGISQAALGYIRETMDLDARIGELPTQIYNAIGRDLDNFGPRTKLIHIKGHNRLRRELFSSTPRSNRYPHLVTLWRKYEAEGRRHRDSVGSQVRMGGL